MLDMLMKKYCLLIILLAMSFSSVYAQNVTIKGTIEQTTNKTVRLSMYNDRVSMYEKPVSEVLVKSPADTFSFKMSINYPTQVILQVETYSHVFFVEPNRIYNLTIPEFDWSMDERINTFTNPITLPIVFGNMDEKDLNIELNKFDSLYAATITNYKLFLNKNRKVIDTVIALFNEHFDSVENDYFVQYKKYRIAAVELAMRLKGKNTLAKTYFSDQPILHRNAGYMDFFNMFFESYFIDGTKHIKKYQMIDWVHNGDLFKLLDSLGTDPILKNEQFRELVFLKGMRDAYFKPEYKSEAVTELLKKYIAQTKFNDYKIIAQGLIEQHESAIKGREARNFKLPDINKELVSLDAFKGKWVYLSFVRLREQPSLRELASMAHYYDTITSQYNMEFVTISCDREFQRMYHFLRNSKDGDKYNWTWLHYDNNYSLLDTYKVRIYPFFILINPQGEIVSYPAKSPGEGFFLSLGNVDKKETNTEQEHND